MTNRRNGPRAHWGVRPIVVGPLLAGCAPTSTPTSAPTASPTQGSAVVQSAAATVAPSPSPSPSPTPALTASPSPAPTVQPTRAATPIPTSAPTPTPTPLVATGSAIAVAAGADHTCAIIGGGAVKCWGLNGSGQLGNTGPSTNTPVAVSGLASGVTAIAAGFAHTCALTSSAGVKCWGDNRYGQLGNGSTTSSAIPVDVLGLTSGVTVIAAGARTTCAITEGGGVKCWGLNDFGQLGNGSTSAFLSTPVDVSGLTTGVTAIAVAWDHVCALMAVGGVKCWGRNSYGQLGNGSTSDSVTPVDVSILVGKVAAIAVGNHHTCAITEGGGVKCWGRSWDGTLGNGSTTESAQPVDVSGLTSGVTAIAAGMIRPWTRGGDVCALTSGGGVKCWGYNAYGQLGNGSTTNSSTPVDVSGLASGITAITVRGSHTCALTSGGGVVCWGSNVSGELGNPITLRSEVPVVVSGL